MTVTSRASSPGDSLCVDALAAGAGDREATPIEVEPSTSNTVLGLLTTTDGTAQPVLERIPKNQRLSWLDPQTPWDHLTLDTQRQLLQKMAENDKPFLESRRAGALKVRDTVKVRLIQPQTFMGRRYEAGETEIDLKNLFHEVEYCCDETGKNKFSNVELHFRAAGLTSGQAVLELRKLWSILGLPPPALHSHLLARVPLKEINDEPRFYATWMNDFSRRVNLLGELISLYYDKIHIRQEEQTVRWTLRKGQVARVRRTFFSYAEGTDFSEFYQFFLERRPTQSNDNGHRRGLVQPRAGYRNPVLWGLEYRGISAKTPNEILQPTLDTIQSLMERRDFGLEAETREWWAYIQKLNSPDLESHFVGAICYNQPWSHLLLGKKSIFKDFVTAVGMNRVEALMLLNSLKTHSRNRNELKMLVFDWSRDTMFFNYPERREKILIAQVEALARFKKHVSIWQTPKEIDEKVSSIMSQFLIDSGLFDAVVSSLGMKFVLNPEAESNKK